MSYRRPALSVTVPAMVCLSALLFLGSGTTGAQAPASGTAPEGSASVCPNNDTGLQLPSGFCATLFAEGIGHARHLVVASNGVVYVNTWSGRYYANQPVHPGGFLIALQDTTGSGRANVIERFGESIATGGHGGTGIALHDGYIYAEINDRIVRYALPPTSIVPVGPEQTVLSGMPLTGDHPMHPFAIDADGWLYVDIASATNSCQERNRMLESPGIKPLHRTHSPRRHLALSLRSPRSAILPRGSLRDRHSQCGRHHRRCQRPRCLCNAAGSRSARPELAKAVYARTGCNSAGRRDAPHRQGRGLRLAAVLLRRRAGSSGAGTGIRW